MLRKGYPLLFFTRSQDAPRLSQCVGMDATPGGKDESKVPASLRRGQEIDVGDRVLLLMGTITLTLFTFISQV